MCVVSHLHVDESSRLPCRSRRTAVLAVLGLLCVAGAASAGPAAAQVPALPATPGAPPQLTPPTVIPQNPDQSRIPNIGRGGGTLGKPSAIPDPLGYDDRLYFRRPKPPPPPPVVIDALPKRLEPPPLPTKREKFRRKLKRQ